MLKIWQLRVDRQSPRPNSAAACDSSTLRAQDSAILVRPASLLLLQAGLALLSRGREFLHQLPALHQEMTLGRRDIDVAL